MHIAILWSAQLMSYLVALLNVVFRRASLGAVLPVQPRRSRMCARVIGSSALPLASIGLPAAV